MPWSLYPIREFAALESAWKNLNEGAANTPLLDPDFVRPLLHIFGTGSEKLAVRDGTSAPTAMAILAPRGRFAWDTFQPKQAPLGFWVQEPSLPTADLAVELLEALRPRPLVLGVLHQDPALSTPPLPSPSIRLLDYIPTAAIEFPATFETYWTQRSKNFRHTINRQQNVLKREGRRVTLEQVTSAAEMRRCVEEYGAVESAGWKGASNSAISGDNDQGRFYTEMLETFAARGEALVSRYLYDGRLVSSDINLCRGGVLYTLKTTYDEAERATSPAQLMKRDLYQDLVDGKKLSRVEYYGRMLEWHTKWKTSDRTLFHINVYRWPLVHRVHEMLKSARRTSAGAVGGKVSEAQV